MEYFDKNGEFNNLTWAKIAGKLRKTANGKCQTEFSEHHLEILKNAYKLSDAQMKLALSLKPQYNSKDDYWLIILPDICSLLASKSQSIELWESYGNGSKPPSFINRK